MKGPTWEERPLLHAAWQARCLGFFKKIFTVIVILFYFKLLEDKMGGRLILLSGRYIFNSPMCPMAWNMIQIEKILVDR